MSHSHLNQSLFLKGLVIGILLALPVLLLPIPPLAAGNTSFFDGMDSYDTNRWNKADGWANPPPFDVGWRADHIVHSNSIMVITLDDQPCLEDCSGKSYASGELRTAGSGDAAYYGYGCFEARFKAPSGRGLVTSFFTYNGGDWDTPPGGNGLHNEIDIEILGKDTTQMQVNFYTNGEVSHEQKIPLGFNAAAGFHDYGFKWTETGIDWYVDGNSVYSVPNTGDNTTPNAAPANGGPHKIMMNFWSCDMSVEDWCGSFTYQAPLHAEYDWVRYQSGSDCTLTKKRLYLPLILRNQ